MSQNFFQIIRPVHVHLKTDKVDLKKRPPWKNFFFHFFSIDSSSRHEKRCQMLQRLFWLFQCSKNPQWIVCTFPKSEANNKEKFYFIADTVSKNTSNKVLQWDLFLQYLGWFGQVVQLPVNSFLFYNYFWVVFT